MNVNIITKENQTFSYHDVNVDFYKNIKNNLTYMVISFFRENGYECYYHFPLQLIKTLEINDD